MSLIPHEVFERLDHAAAAMDDMNTKLDTVTGLLVEIRDLLKESQ